MEVIIDASVKTGDDLSAVRDWCYMACEMILVQGIAVPKILIPRLSIDRESGRRMPRAIETKDHFLDELLAGSASARQDYYIPPDGMNKEKYVRIEDALVGDGNNPIEMHSMLKRIHDFLQKIDENVDMQGQ